MRAVLPIISFILADNKTNATFRFLSGEAFVKSPNIVKYCLIKNKNTINIIMCAGA